MSIGKKKRTDEVELALKQWKEALRRFDAAQEDEAGFCALELEAAKRRYIMLLERSRGAYEK